MNQNACLLRKHTVYSTSVNPKLNFDVSNQTKDDQTPMIMVPLSCLTSDKGNAVRNTTNLPGDPPRALPKLHLTTAPPTKDKLPPTNNTAPLTSATALPTDRTASSLHKLPSNGDSHQGQTTMAPSSAPKKPHNPAGNFHLTTSLFIVIL